MFVRAKIATLADFVDSLQERGQYTFSGAQALRVVGTSAVGLKRAAERLKQKRRIASPRRGFYTIVPLEYRQSGAPPASWFIDQFMQFQGKPYYVGLLSAAALHGAAHQQPQEFQVFSTEQLRPVVVGRNRIRFLVKKDLERTPVENVKTNSGAIRISTAEATAVDLVRYQERAGYLSHVATVLAELAEKIDPQSLATAAKIENDLAVAQRLGYVLDAIGAEEKTGPLSDWIDAEKPRMVLLRPDRRGEETGRNRKWRVIVNDKIEMDEL